MELDSNQVDSAMQLPPAHGELALPVQRQGVREAREPLVELAPQRRDLTLLALECGQLGREHPLGRRHARIVGATVDNRDETLERALRQDQA